MVGKASYLVTKNIKHFPFKQYRDVHILRVSNYPNKSKSNKDKHGIDFEASKALWLDLNRLEVQAKSDDEPRFALIAMLNKKLWTAYYTIRGNRIRIISVRRSRKGEMDLYHEGERFG